MTSFQPLDLGTLSFNNAPFYKKVACVTAEPATPGQTMRTVMANGHMETVNTAVEGDYLVTNPSGERYFLSGAKLFAKYRPTSNQGEYEPVGNPVRVIFIDKNVSFIAPWGEEQFLQQGGVVVNNDGSVYGIQGPEFAETYALCDEDGNLI